MVKQERTASWKIETLGAVRVSLDEIELTQLTHASRMTQLKRAISLLSVEFFAGIQPGKHRASESLINSARQYLSQGRIQVYREPIAKGDQRT
jgi:hypothetical protein